MRVTRTFAIAAAALATAGSAAAQAPRPSIDLARAVAAAESALDAKAFEAELEVERGAPVYEVSLVRQGRPMEAEVDATSGKVLRSQAPRFRLPWGGEDLKAAQTAPRGLAETIARIEAATKGKVSEIGLERRGGRHYYEVELTGAPDREILVDLRTGAITPQLDH